jgi:CHAD domain-containing protein
MAEDLLDLEIARLRRDLRALVARGGADLFTVLLRLRDRRDAVGSETLAALLALGDRYEPEALHGLRILARRLRYLAEIADAVTGRDSGAPALFKDLQERLGRIHDTHVLALWLAGQVEATRTRGKPALATEARKQQAFFLDASRAHHRALLELGPAELLRHGLEAMGAARSAA